jgi:Flp pilus assembly protein TadB
MITSILTILAALVPFVIWLWKKRDQQQSDPDENFKRRSEQIAREIVQRDPAAANRALDDDLERLHTLQSHQRGAGSPPSADR